MAKELGIRSVGAIANKITKDEQIDVIRSQLKDVVLLGSVTYSRSVQEADLGRAAVIGADAELVKQLREAKDSLMDLIAPDVDSEVGDKRFA